MAEAHILPIPAFNATLEAVSMVNIVQKNDVKCRSVLPAAIWRKFQTWLERYECRPFHPLLEGLIRQKMPNMRRYLAKNRCVEFIH